MSLLDSLSLAFKLHFNLNFNINDLTLALYHDNLSTFNLVLHLSTIPVGSTILFQWIVNGLYQYKKMPQLRGNRLKNPPDIFIIPEHLGQNHYNALLLPKQKTGYLSPHLRKYENIFLYLVSKFETNLSVVL